MKCSTNLVVATPIDTVFLGDKDAGAPYFACIDRRFFVNVNIHIEVSGKVVDQIFLLLRPIVKQN
jgi:hypothetical protein